MLEAFSFSKTWLNWVLALVSLEFLSILINGSPSATFSTSRDIHQGDPLSSYLFIILVEGLGIFVKVQVQENHIQGIHLNSFEIPHSDLQFLEETILLGNSSVQEARAFWCNLRIFGEALGMSINCLKSHIFFFHTPILT